MGELGCGEGFDIRRAKLAPCVLLRIAGKIWRVTEREIESAGERE